MSEPDVLGEDRREVDIIGWERGDEDEDTTVEVKTEVTWGDEVRVWVATVVDVAEDTVAA